VIFNFSGLVQAVSFGLLKKELAVALVSVFIMLFVHILRKQDTFEQLISKQKIVLRWSFYLVILLWIMVFGESGGENFIYFQF
jgi:alginate O-acetyltransferase complex protein AlgI